MNYNDFLKKKSLTDNLYLIVGEEKYLADKVESFIKKEFLADNLDGVIAVNGVAEIKELSNTVNSVPFFAPYNFAVVKEFKLLRDSKKNAEKSKEKDEEDFLTLINLLPQFSILVLIADKVDKRRKIYKAIDKNGTIIEVNRLKVKEVREWLEIKLRELGKSFDSEANQYFLEVVSRMSNISLGLLDQEINKIGLYNEEKIITKKDLVNVFAGIPEASIFALTDAIGERKLVKALNLLKEQIANGEHFLKILTMLIREVRLLLRAKQLKELGYSHDNIATKLELLSFIADKVIEKSRNFTEKKLEQALINLAQLDGDFKTGQADNVAMEKIIIDLIKK